MSMDTPRFSKRERIVCSWDDLAEQPAHAGGSDSADSTPGGNDQMHRSIHCLVDEREIDR